MVIGSVTVPFSDLDTKLRDDASLVVSPHSHLSYYVETRDLSLEEEGEPASKVEEQPARWGLWTNWASCVPCWRSIRVWWCRLMGQIPNWHRVNGHLRDSICALGESPSQPLVNPAGLLRRHILQRCQRLTVYLTSLSSTWNLWWTGGLGGASWGHPFLPAHGQHVQYA